MTTCKKTWLCVLRPASGRVATFVTGCDWTGLGVTDCDWQYVSMDQEQRDQLAPMVTTARLKRGLGKDPAARDIGVSRITLKRVEDAKPVRDDILAKILNYFDLPLPGEPAVEPIRTAERDRIRQLIEQTDVSPELRQRLLDALQEAGDGHADDEPGSAPITGT